MAIDEDRSPVRSPGHVLDARDRASGEIAEHRVPVERPDERQPQGDAAVRDETVAGPAAGAKLAGGSAEHLPAGAVELTDAAETCSERDVSDREVGVIEEPASEVRSARASELVRRDPQMLLEQPAQMTGGDEQSGGEVVLGPAVQGPVDDELDRSADDFGTGPAGRRRGAVGAAPQTGAVPRCLGRRGECELADVAGERTRGTPRPTVDPRGDDGGEAGHSIDDRGLGPPMLDTFGQEQTCVTRPGPVPITGTAGSIPAGHDPIPTRTPPVGQQSSTRTPGSAAGTIPKASRDGELVPSRFDGLAQRIKDPFHHAQDVDRPRVLEEHANSPPASRATVSVERMQL
jgi:hypothetical protein